MLCTESVLNTTSFLSVRQVYPHSRRVPIPTCRAAQLPSSVYPYPPALPNSSVSSYSLPLNLDRSYTSTHQTESLSRTNHRIQKANV